MKKLVPVLMVAVVAFLLFQSGILSGGVSVDKGAGPQAPDLPPADEAANNAAEAARGGADVAADTIAGLDKGAWQLIAVLMGVGAIVWVWKDAKRRAFVLGLVAVALLVYVVSR